MSDELGLRERGDRSSATSAALPEGRPFRLTAKAFNSMIEANLFEREDRVGLWDGQIYEKVSRDHVHHMLPTVVLNTLLRSVPDGWFVGWEQSVELGPHHLPLVDQVLIRDVPGRYIDHWPRPDEIGLVLEWFKKSLRIDLGVKLAGFAGAGVPSYWLLDLAEQVIRTYEEPARIERRYTREAAYPIGQAIPLRLDGVIAGEVPTIDLLPFCI